MLQINRYSEFIITDLIQMSLEKYNEKRDFNLTEEPEGTVARSKDSLVFVVQKHAAVHRARNHKLGLGLCVI